MCEHARFDAHGAQRLQAQHAGHRGQDRRVARPQRRGRRGRRGRQRGRRGRHAHAGGAGGARRGVPAAGAARRAHRRPQDAPRRQGRGQRVRHTRVRLNCLRGTTSCCNRSELNLIRLSISNSPKFNNPHIMCCAT